MNTNARYPEGVVIEPVPNLASSFWMFVEIPADETLVEILPRIAANVAIPSAQVARLPRSLRSAYAVGEDSSLRCGTATSRAGEDPCADVAAGADPCGEDE